MKNYNKILLFTLLYSIGVILIVALLCAIFGSPVEAVYYDDFHIQCGQEHFVIEDENGYKNYEAFAHWTQTNKGLKLSSMEAKYLNGALTINSTLGFSLPKYEMVSPLTCEQLTGYSFIGEFGIPEKKKDLKEENISLKKENKNLSEKFKALTEQVEAILKVLNNL